MKKIRAIIKSHVRMYQFVRAIEAEIRGIENMLDNFFFGVKKEMSMYDKAKFSFGNKLKKHGRKNIIKLEKAYCKHNLFDVYGSYNRITIGSGSRIENVEFEIGGENNCISIGRNVVLRNSIIGIGDSGSSLFIGDNTTIGKGLKVVALESARVHIGSDCMFSTNVSIMNSDSHSIIDLNTHRRTNLARDVNIGNHVWFGEDVTVLKGAIVQDDVVIGNRSMLTRGIYRSNNIYVGVPARVLGGG